MRGLAGKTALITGGGSGIGAACAVRLAAEGVKVAVADLQRTPPRLSQRTSPSGRPGAGDRLRRHP